MNTLKFKLFASIFSVLLFTGVRTQCLSGIYTIGGTAPDYTSVSQAVSSLTTNGVCGPVTFHIRPGTYTGAVSIGNISGVSQTNTVTFTSENADSSTTILQTAGTSTINYVININGADYVTFSRLTLKNTGTVYSAAVTLSNGSNYFALENCVLEAPVATSVSSSKYLFSTTNNNQYTKIKNNYFKNGVRGVNYISFSSVLNSLIIEENKFENNFESGINVNSVKNPRITLNTILNSAAATSYTGILLNYCNDTITVTKNKIELDKGIGICLDNAYSTFPSVITNNAVLGTGTNPTSGIRVSYCSNINVYHNTVSVFSNSSGYCLQLTTNTAIQVKNNILYNRGTGYVYYGTPPVTSIDYNACYTAGTVFANFSSVNYPYFLNWQSLNYDQNSLNALPQFVSSTDLHIASDFSQNLTLPFLVSVPTDIEGTARDNTSPYFGAYEYFNTPIASDCGVSALLSPGTKSCSGANNVKVRIKNYGTTPLSSATINWTVDGIAQVPYSWSGNLNFYDTSSVTIGSFTFNPGAQHVIKAWTSSPNGLTDQFNSNDTLTSPTLYTRLNGTYVIGASGNYTTLASAVADINSRGICGNVTFNLDNGTYAEYLHIVNLSLSSSSDLLEFRSTTQNSSAVTISFNTLNALKISNSKNIRFKHLSFSCVSTFFNTVSLESTVQNVQFDSCSFTAGTSKACIASAAPTNCRLLDIYECSFLAGGTSINLSNFNNVSIQNSTGIKYITLNLTDTLNISGNQTAAAGGRIDLNSTQNYRIERNNLYNYDNSILYLSNSSGTNNIVANNFIRLDGSSATNAVTFSLGYVKFYNNSLNIQNVNSSTNGFYANSSSSFIVKNNVFKVSGAGFCINDVNPPSSYAVKPQINFNGFYKSGSYLGRSGSIYAATLTQWTSLTGYDSSSVYADPLFTAYNNLHVNEVLLNNAGTSVSGVISDDIDGQPRNLTTPDIGADEFTPLANDGSTTGFPFISPNLCPGNNNIIVRLKNNGSSTLTSADVKYKINSGTTQTYNWTGSLAPGQSTPVTVGSYSFVSGTSYSIKAWSDNPNGTGDLYNINDTSTITKTAAMTGVYTIGGTSPDFATFNAAVTALQAGGICGPVTFNVRNGTYTEQVRLQGVAGASSTNTVTFKSENNDSSLVSLEYNSTMSWMNYTLNLDTTKYVTIEKIGVKALNSTNGIAVLFSGRVVNTSVRNCKITSVSTSSSSFYRNNSGAFNLQITDNNVYGGNYGINIATNGTLDTGTVIRNNVVSGNATGGIFMSLAYEGEISGNQVNENSTTVLYGIYGSYLRKSSIKGNKIVNLNKGTGIYLTQCSNGPALANEITNNFISTTQDPCITLNITGDAGVHYNSCFQNGSQTAITIQSSTNTKLSNNCFYKSQSGLISDAVTTGQIFSSTNNNYYNAGGNMFKAGSSQYSTLSAYATATGLEGGSVNDDPMYVSFSDLHSNSQTMNNAGIPVAGITADIDGDPRNASTPDIGADEFTPIVTLNDVQLQSVYTTTISCGGSKTLYAKMKSLGADTLHSVQFTILKDGAAAGIYTWNGTLAPGAVKDSVVIGAFTMFGTHSFKVWTSNPNSASDGNTVNDTALHNTPNFALTGTFTIGGSNPDFTTLSSAKSAVQLSGVCGPVIFDIRPGTYTDTTSFTPVTGASAINTITFRSETGDSSSVIVTDYASSTLQYDHYVIALRSASHFVFSKITFQQSVSTLSASNTYMLYLKGTCNNVSVLNCHFAGNIKTQFPVGSPFTVQNSTITNNYINGGARGIFLNNTSNINNTVSFNTVNNSSDNGITCKGNNSKVHQNTIKLTTTNMYAVGLDVNGNNNSVRRNSVRCKNGRGIWLQGNSDTLANNFAYVSTMTANSGYYNAGLYVSYCYNSKISNNTIRVKSASTTGVFSLFIDYTTNSNQVTNNIFEAKGTSPVMLCSNNSNTFSKNRYHNSASTFATVSSTSYPTFSAYIGAGAQPDNGSQFNPTYFTNDSTYEVAGDFLLNNSASPLSFITDDILGQPRSSTPDIGAYEFNLAANDVSMLSFVYTDSVFCSGNNNITVKFRNHGTNQVTSALINWKLNGTNQTPFSWAGTLNSGDTATVMIGTVNLLPKKNQLLFYTSQPNGITDDVSMNDTLLTSVYKTRLNGIYTIGGSSPDFTTIKQANDTLQYHGVCGPVIFNIRNGTYTSNISLYPVQGASSVNTITWQSESLDSSLVIISDPLPAVKIYGASYVRFRKLTFNTTSGNTFHFLYGNVNDFQISNCVFTNLNANQAIITAGNYYSAQFKNVAVKNSSFNAAPLVPAVYFAGTSGGTNMRGIEISGNTLNTSITLDWADSLFIRNNVMKNILISNAKNVMDISGNKLNSGNIELSQCADNLAYQKKVYNNIIDNGQIRISGVPKLEVFHNTVVVNQAYSVNVYGGCLVLTGIGTQNIANNILINKNTGIAIGISDPNNGLNMPQSMFRNNILYSVADTLVLVNSQTKTLSQWQTLHQQDLTSQKLYPYFVSSSDYHINNDSRINNTGVANTIAVTDYDNSARNTIAPDPGAFEFNCTPVSDDAGVTSIGAAGGSYCAGSSNPVLVKIKNYGSTNLSSVNIESIINGVTQPVFNWTGNLLPDSSVVVSIGTFVPSFSSPSYITAFTSQPNGVNDLNVSNDSTSLPGITGSLNGVYTVGFAGNDFSDMYGAVTAMQTYGICGPVTFKFASGTYNLPTYNAPNINLSYIPGNINSGYPITFESNSANATQVVLNANDGDHNACYSVHHVKNVTIRNLTLHGDYWANHMVVLGTNAENILFEGNIFELHTAQSSMGKGNVYSNEYHRNVQFINNQFSGHHYGILYSHTAANKPENIYVNGNVFDEFYTGVSFNQTDTLVIDSNIFIKTNTYNTSAKAIYVNPQGHVKISRNIVRGSNYYTGIHVAANWLASLKSPSVENNVVNIGCTTGITVETDSFQVVYNTVNATTSYYAMEAKAKITLRNNIINTNGYAMYTVNNLVAADRNDYFTTGSVLIKRNTTNYSTLAAYSGASGYDINSLSVDPQFISAVDMHYQNTILDGLAMPLANVPKDQQNKLRDLLTPNPGAYETGADTIIDTLNTNLELKAILTNTFTPGANNTISARIAFTIPAYADTNYYKYKATIDSLKISYKVNNQATVTEKWYGSLGLLDTLDFTFATPFYVPNGKLYNLVVWYENLDTLQSDLNYGDDTLIKTFILPMQGDYTVGGTYPDFMGYTDLVNSVTTCGTTANVRFLFRTGSYGLMNFSLNNQVNIDGLIELRSESGNADDVHFDLAWMGDVDSIKFSNVTIHPFTGGGTGYGPYDGIQISCVHKLIIDSCKFIGGSTAATKNGFHFLSSYGAPSATITNSSFKHMKHAVYLSSHATYCSSFSNEDFIFENNTVDSCEYGVIVGSFACYYNTKRMRIQNNTINTTVTGIYFFQGNSGFGTNYGEATTTVSGNKINSSGAAISMIYTPFILEMTNNLFSSQLPNQISDVERLKLYNNTFNKHLFLSVSDSSEVYNNIFYTDDSVACLSMSFFTGINYFKNDFNNYFAPNSPIAASFYEVTTGNPYMLNSYQFTHPSQIKDTLQCDSNSVSFTPLFVSPTDLHVQSVNMRDKGKVLTAVTTDIDGDSRLLSAPDLGADETSSVPGDIWPGDADNDMAVTSLDLFAIGLNYNYTGYPRDTVTNLWAGHLCNTWTQTQVNGNNMKFSDCNGDSIINMDDTLSVYLNYNQTHTKMAQQLNSSNADLFIMYDKSLYYSGDTVFASVHIGNSLNVQSNFYGAAFRLNFNNNFVKPGSGVFYYNNSWAGNVNSTKIGFDTVLYGQNVVDASFVRTTHTNVNGYGQVGTYRFILEDSVPGPHLIISASQGVKVDASGQLTPLTTGIDSVPVQNVITTDVKENNSGSFLTVHPNPGKGQYTVRSDKEIKAIFIYDILGHLIRSANVNDRIFKFDISDLPAGIYVIEAGGQHVRVIKE